MQSLMRGSERPCLVAVAAIDVLGTYTSIYSIVLPKCALGMTKQITITSLLCTPVVQRAQPETGRGDR